MVSEMDFWEETALGIEYMVEPPNGVVLSYLMIQAGRDWPEIDC